MSDIISDGGMDPRNKYDKSMDELVEEYMHKKLQHLMNQKTKTDQEFRAMNSIIHSFVDVIWWIKNERTN